MSYNGDEHDDLSIKPQGERLGENRDRAKARYQDSSWLSIELYVKADGPELLTGLDQLMQLNLVSDAQVKKICRSNLSCVLPETEPVPSNLARGINTTAIANETSVTILQQAVQTTVKPNIVTQIGLRFLEELSIRWLLFLGIFLVVISSGVLAASQWANFPNFGQYLILLVYTLSFWGFGFWSAKQDNLQLTSQTLRAIATLLVPINFWAMGHFGLGNNIWEWLTIALAFVALTGSICFKSYFKPKPQLPETGNSTSEIGENIPRENKFFIPLFLIFSYLHLGWQIPVFLPVFLPVFPILAVYGGILLLIWLHYQFLLPLQRYPTIRLLFLFAAWSTLLSRSLISHVDTSLNIGVNTSEFASYNLAIALFAWLLGTISLTLASQNDSPGVSATDTLEDRDDTEYSTESAATFLSRIWQFISIFILGFAWIISVRAGIWKEQVFFWQTVGISLLAIHLFGQRLTLYWRKRDLTAIFLIGLQALYVSKELIPASLRSQALDLAVGVSKTTYFPESVLGVTLFPYVILYVVGANWLYRQQKPQLALYTEWLTLILGLSLTCLSLFNPVWRSLNLLLATVTLGYVSYLGYIREPFSQSRKSLIYLTHLLGLVTIVNGIAVSLPDLSQSTWGSILVLLTVGEWSIYLRRGKHVKQPRQIIQPQIKITNVVNFISLLEQSCWYFGLLLGTLSYTCFLSQAEALPSPLTFRWGLAWLIIPGMLTLIAQYTCHMQQRRLATSLSCISLVLAQLLTFGLPGTRFMALVVAIALMFANSFNLRRTKVAFIHLGMGLGLIASLFHGFMSNDLISDGYWLSLGGAMILLLYKFRLYLNKVSETPKFDYISQRTAHGILGVGIEAKNYKLIGKYIQAADYWAIALIALEISIVSIIYLDFRDLGIALGVAIPYLLATLLVAWGIFWRYQKQPNNLVLYALVWLGELFTIGLIIILGGSNLICAIANISLGLLSLLVLDRLAQGNSPWTRLNLAYIPIVYAALGTIWRGTHFSSYTGILTLGAAYILINTRQGNSKINTLINYLGLAGISCGIYELVIYRLSLSTTSSVADSLAVLALVAAAIAFTYRLGAWWYARRHRTVMLNFPLPRIIAIAHLHWAISSILEMLAAAITIGNQIGTTATYTIGPTQLTLVNLASSLCLGAYALIQGRRPDFETSADREKLNGANLDETSLDRSSLDWGNDWWVYIGIIEIIATLAYGRLVISGLSFLDPWRVIFTCAVALGVYHTSWQNFGWCPTPWKRTALIMPTLTALVTAPAVSYLSLGLAAVFYLHIAYDQKNLRWSYGSLGLINWGIVKLIWQFNTEFIWLAAVISLSILYIAQLDPYFSAHGRQRHYLRLAGSGFLCVATLSHPDWGIILGIISFCLIFAGLGLKVRAFLYVGTVALILTVIYQLVILVLTYSFLKWIVGLLVGVGTIIAAAGFEKRRDRL